MERCKCGSYAINNDPERKICDVCYARVQGWKAGMEEAEEIVMDWICTEDTKFPTQIIDAIRQRIEETP